VAEDARIHALSCAALRVGGSGGGSGGAGAQKGASSPRAPPARAQSAAPASQARRALLRAQPSPGAPSPSPAAATPYDGLLRSLHASASASAPAPEAEAEPTQPQPAALASLKRKLAARSSAAAARPTSQQLPARPARGGGGGGGGGVSPSASRAAAEAALSPSATDPALVQLSPPADPALALPSPPVAPVAPAAALPAPAPLLSRLPQPGSLFLRRRPASAAQGLETLVPGTAAPPLLPGAAATSGADAYAPRPPSRAAAVVARALFESPAPDAPVQPLTAAVEYNFAAAKLSASLKSALGKRELLAARHAARTLSPEDPLLPLPLPLPRAAY
jgi:hypothetical protein